MNDLSAELAAALEQLNSGDLEARVRAVEDAVHVVNRVLDRVLEEFEKPGSARYLIFKRLGRFGSVAIEPLEQLLQRTEDHELQVLTAAVLLTFGSGAGVQVLLDAIRPDDPLVCVAVRVLADAGVAKAASRIEAAISKCDIQSTVIIECLVAALRRFANPLPEAVQMRLQAVEPTWLRDSLLK